MNLFSGLNFQKLSWPQTSHISFKLQLKKQYDHELFQTQYQSHRSHLSQSNLKCEHYTAVHVQKFTIKYKRTSFKLHKKDIHYGIICCTIIHNNRRNRIFQIVLKQTLIYVYVLKKIIYMWMWHIEEPQCHHVKNNNST